MILEEFKKITSKDLQLFFKKADIFFKTDYQEITSFYQGKIKQISSIAIANFVHLKTETNSVFEVFHLHSSQMKNQKFWNLLEVIEEVESRLFTLSNMNKWARSSVSNTSYSSSVQFEYVMKQNQSLEDIAKLVLEQSNYQDSWFDIAKRNHLFEVDYDNEGGVELLLELDSTSNLTIQVNSVVDTLQGKSIYGKDLYKSIIFVDDDLKTLDYDKTVEQSVNIMINHKKNHHPDYPSLGLQSTLVVGGNRALMNFPVIIRQLTEVFESDDTFKQFTVNSLSIEQDNLFSDFKVFTRLNEIIQDSRLL